MAEGWTSLTPQSVNLANVQTHWSRTNYRCGKMWNGFNHNWQWRKLLYLPSTWQLWQFGIDHQIHTFTLLAHHRLYNPQKSSELLNRGSMQQVGDSANAPTKLRWNIAVAHQMGIDKATITDQFQQLFQATDTTRWSI
ncbi:unnamed protein product [Prorocentrum cordatum]|uniref:Uncharacterized protein n=1 Tax=Prorocentrum cordatum TaxID=2364126 RepID=A0ABN9TK08_9DINO|nr:unnamed protein product [Polarella glacialis]